ncbi:hypothetical protein JCM5353_003585 [Sporobolomyces roseus]
MSTHTRVWHGQGTERRHVNVTHSTSVRRSKWEKPAIIAAFPIALCPFGGPTLSISLLWMTQAFRDSIKPHTGLIRGLSSFIVVVGLLISGFQVWQTTQGDRWFLFTTTGGMATFYPQHAASVLILWGFTFMAWRERRKIRIRQPEQSEDHISLRALSRSGREASNSDVRRSTARSRGSSIHPDEETSAISSGSDDGGHTAVFDLPRRRNTDSRGAAGDSRRATSHSSSTRTLLNDPEMPGTLSRPEATHPRNRDDSYDSEESSPKDRRPAHFA